LSRIAFAVLAWHRRWISDDGLIVVRTVRTSSRAMDRVNAFERAEANTSTLWQWYHRRGRRTRGGDPVFTTVVIGWVLLPSRRS